MMGAEAIVLAAHESSARRSVGHRIARSVAVAVFTSAVLWPSAAECGGNVAATVHNLSPSGPGKQKDTRAAGTCAYCHTQHNSAPLPALWSRSSSGVSYRLYSSASMLATVNQPTGSSRLCLSCHDGILALASAQLGPSFPTSAASAAPLTGRTMVGTDLRASHPVSFTYDTALVAKQGELVDPSALPSTVRLDATGQMQCTSCHDPHDDTLPQFLRVDNSQGRLCAACHRLTAWSVSSHATSTATWTGGGIKPWPAGGTATVGTNGCNNCHRSHNAGHADRLLVRAVETENCTVCHGGTVDKKNLAAEFTTAAKASRHPIEAAPWTHAPNENTASMPRHVTCADCHNAHQTRPATARDVGLPGPLLGVSGVSAEGTPRPLAAHEYEVCFKCHGESATAGVVRASRSRNIREKVAASNASYHPILAAAGSGSAGSLVSGYSASSTIGCIDCHNNSDASPRGPHASRYAPILERNYAVADIAVESPSAYALCYKCHDRNAIVAPPRTHASGPSALPTSPAGNGARSAGTLRSPNLLTRRAGLGGSGFPHWLHVVKNQTSCAVCHDSHGSRSNAHLIDFMTRDSSGRPVVTANTGGRLEYSVTGSGQGTCYLACHGRDHGPLSY